MKKQRKPVVPAALFGHSSRKGSTEGTASARLRLFEEQLVIAVGGRANNDDYIGTKSRVDGKCVEDDCKAPLMLG